MSNLTKQASARSDYRLLDFGDGRKLEAFGHRIIDRPSPAAEVGRKRRPERWGEADSFFDAEGRRWRHRTAWDEPIELDCGEFRMPIAPTPFGHVGIFPEQTDNWRWLIDTAPRTDTAGSATAQAAPVRGPSGLNLFGYTGASSIAMAVSGMNVAHVDAAKQNVSAARAAAKLNGLDEHPIRYLVDDAAKFVAREGRRGRRYHTIVMDPPAYGHSPSGEAWRLERDLWPLVDAALSLLTPESFRLLITGHSPQIGTLDVLDYLDSRVPERLGLKSNAFAASVRSGRLSLIDTANRKLDAGFFVRCTYN
jgi:23S rRNA (cytosine1962-C5)-methyltransferase